MLALPPETPILSVRHIAVGAKRDWTRPWVRDEVLDGGPRYAPVPDVVIRSMIPCPLLKPQDCKLLIVLMAVIWNDLNPATDFTPKPWALAQELRRAIGKGTTKNSLLRASLQRLASVAVLRNPENDAAPWHPLLAEYKIMRGPDGDEVTWAFTTALEAECYYPLPWSYVDLTSCANLRCKYSFSLYVLLSGLVRQCKKNHRISIGELRTWLGVEGTYTDWYALRTWVLERAVAEINSVSDLRVSFEGVSIRRGGSIRQVQLYVQPTPMRSEAIDRGRRAGSTDKLPQQWCRRAA